MSGGGGGYISWSVSTLDEIYPPFANCSYTMVRLPCNFKIIKARSDFYEEIFPKIICAGTKLSGRGYW